MHLARCRQEPMVITIGKHATRASCDAIDGACQPRADRFHAAPERRAILRFDDQVSMIALQRVVHEPEARPDASVGERALDLADDPHRSE